jgi:hypothetical protein
MSFNGSGLASVATDGEAQKMDLLGSKITSENKAFAATTQAAIRADLIGSQQASAAGIVATGHAPVLKLCRALIKAGHDSQTPLEVYRGATLCFRARSIGEGALLTVEDSVIGRPRFVRHRPRACGAAPPSAKNGRGL